MTKKTAAEARREYYRRWRQTHREQIAATNARYWAKKAAEMDATEKEATTDREQKG